MATLAQVVGRNSRALRLEAGISLEEFAMSAREFGLPWSTGRVGDFEGGRVAPSFPTLYAVALALRTMTGQPITLAQLFAGEDWVELNDVLAVELSDVRAAVSGELVPVGALWRRQGDAWLGIGNDEEKLHTSFERGFDPGSLATAQFREADLRICKKLGVTPERGQAAMLDLWQRTFTAERDFRAGPDANAQRKGQISRQLIDELDRAISNMDYS